MSNTSKEPVEIEFKDITYTTDRATLYRIDDETEVWIPLSELIEDDDHSFTIPEWLAYEKGLI